MSKKRGNGGHGLENFDPNTGRYISEDEAVLNKVFGLDYKENGSMSYLPKTDSTNKKRLFYEDLDDYQQEIFMNKILKPQILEKMERIEEKAMLQTHTIKSPERIEMRKRIIDEVILSQKQKRFISNDYEATIILGLPGSGKSTIANPLADQKESFIIDADIMKEKIPEYIDDKEMVSAVHAESVQMSNDMLEKVSNDGSNIIVGKVGGHYPDIKKLVDYLSEKNYKIKVILNDVPFDVSLERNILRYESGQTERIVPYWIVTDSDKKIFYTYDRLLKDSKIQGGAIYSNDVRFGDKPKLLKTDGRAEDLKLW